MEKEELKKWRDKNNFTQAELATKLEVAINTISRWETGERAIPSFLKLALKAIEIELKNKQSG